MNAPKTCRVFISSTTKDLWQYRQVAREVISQLYEWWAKYFPLSHTSMDTEPLDGERTTSRAISQRWVDEADWVVLIVAWNYGYVPEGQQYSVTEWEFHQATEVSKPPKKCFVFIAAEPDDKPHPYRALSESIEQVNLLSFRGAPDNRKHEAELNAFKKRLRDERVLLFTDIENFRAQLSTTLTNMMTAATIDTLGPVIVTLGLQPLLQRCFDEVKILAGLKRLHDRLHHVRQFGIRPLRECTVAGWSDGSDLPISVERELSRSNARIAGYMGEIRMLLLVLPKDQRDGIKSLDKVMRHQIDFDKVVDKSSFIDSIDVFASSVQKAFTACNLEMERAERRLSDGYYSVTASVESALALGKVATTRADTIKAQLEISQRIHKRLCEVLRHHQEWQDVHDELERIDTGLQYLSASDSEEDQDRLQAGLRQSTLALVSNDGESVRTLLSAAWETWKSEDASRLVAWPALIATVQKNLDQFVAELDLGTYQHMRKAFDDLFFEIDIETLFTVEASEGRVQAMEVGLCGLKAAFAVPEFG